MDHDDLDTQDQGKGMSTAKMVALPAAAVAALGGMVVIGLLGFGAGFMSSTREVTVTRAPTPDELDAACAPEVAEVQDELTTAQVRVNELERTAAEKEGQVQELEARIARGAEVGKELRAELARVKAELEETKEQLAVAIEEKEQLLVELRETEQELEETKETLVVRTQERDDAREDALYNRWDDFLGDAQLEICEQGNRKKLGNCRESVMAALATDSRRDRFAHCIRSGQAQPMVRELEKDVELPQYSEMMDEEIKQVKGWFVEFCDPTLPELDGAPLAQGRLPRG